LAGTPPKTPLGDLIALLDTLTDRFKRRKRKEGRKEKENEKEEIGGEKHPKINLWLEFQYVGRPLSETRSSSISVVD